VKDKSQVKEYYHLKMGFLNLKVSVSGTGTFKGSMEVTENWTYWTIQRSDGTFYGKGKGIIMIKDGNEVTTATGHGEGKMRVSGKMRYLGTIFYTPSPKEKLSFLAHLIGVNEYEVVTSGNYEHKL
jgi:hypothetical protein